jgi:hypothetical protein
MSDVDAFFRDHPDEQPSLLGGEDLRLWQSDCACHVCVAEAADIDKKRLALFEDCDSIYPISTDELEDYQYLLCPKQIPVFDFKTRVWGMVAPSACHYKTDQAQSMWRSRTSLSQYSTTL